MSRVPGEIVAGGIELLGEGQIFIGYSPAKVSTTSRTFTRSWNLISCSWTPSSSRTEVRVVGQDCRLARPVLRWER